MAAEICASDNAFRKGQGFAAAGDYTNAAASYKESVAADPNNIKARCGHGMALQRLGRHTEAIADFTHVIESFPSWSGAFVAYYGRAVSRHALGKFAETIRDCSEALRRKSDYADVFYLRGIALEAAGDFAAATNDMDKVLAIDGCFTAAQLVRGRLYVRQRRWTQAISDLSAAVNRLAAESQECRQAAYLRGIARQESGDHDAAIADFTLVITRDPTNATARLRRSRSLYELGERSLAELDLKYAGQIANKDLSGES